jgi:hypothetical protein
MKKKKVSKPQLKTPAQFRARIKALEDHVSDLEAQLMAGALQSDAFNQERMRMKLYADACERRFLAIRALVNDDGR